MNVVMNRLELLSAVKRAANIAPAESPLDVLRGILLETDAASMTLTATNMEVALEQKVPCESKDNDALVINARLFAEVVDNLEGEHITLCRQKEHKNVTIKGGKAVFCLNIWEKGSFPKMEIPFPEDTVKVTGIPGMAKRTAFAVDLKNEQPLLKCVNLMFTKNGLKAVGSDGSCVVSAKGDDKSTGNVNLLIPALSLSRLARICDDKDEFRVGTTGNSIVFSKENFTYSARLMDGNYIDSDRLIGMLSNEFTVLTDVLELRTSLRAATAIDQNGKVKLTFKGNQLAFSTAGDDGAGSSTLEVVPLTKEPKGEYWYAVRQLLACLSALSGTVTLGIAQGGMLTLSTPEAFYMQTGLRATVAKATNKARKQPAPKAA